MPYSYDLAGGAGLLPGGISPLRIANGIVDPLWYKARSSTATGYDNVSPYNVTAVPIAFNKDMELSSFMLQYISGAANYDGFPAGLDAVMIRFGLYDANEDNTPGTKIADYAWSAYTPGLSDPNGGFKQINFEGFESTMLANKLYFWVTMIVGVTNDINGDPDSVHPDDVQGFFQYWVSPSVSTDPMASVGMTDAEVVYHPSGISSYYVGDIVDAICFTAGAALDPLPETLGALWDTTFTSSNPPVFYVKGQPV